MDVLNFIEKKNNQLVNNLFGYDNVNDDFVSLDNYKDNYYTQCEVY